MSFLNIVMYIIPFITLPYQVRVLGPEKFGLVAFAAAFIQYFSVLNDYGFEASATRRIALYRHNQKSMSQIFCSVMLIKFTLLIFSLLVIPIITFLVPGLRNNLLIVIMSLPLMFGGFLFPVWLFLGNERMKYVSFVNILSRSLFLVLLFVFIHKPDDYYLVPVINSLGAIIAGILSLYIGIKRFKIILFIPKLKAIMKEFRHSTQFFYMKLSQIIYANTNTFALGLTGAPTYVGYYASANKISTAVSYILYSIQTVLYPYMTKHKNLDFYKKVFWLSLMLIAGVSGFMFIFSKQIILLIFGSDMLYAHNILRIFSIVIFVGLINSLLGYSLLGAFGHMKESNNVIIYASIFHVIMLFVLYAFGKLDVFNITYLVVLTNVLMLSTRIFLVKKYNLWSPQKAK